MFHHHDSLERLNKGLPLNQQLAVIHQHVKDAYPFIARIAVATYDNKNGMLKTFISSNRGDTPLAQYEAPLNEARSLADMIQHGRPRIVNELALFAPGEHRHTQVIKEQGFAASYTHAMYLNGRFEGFIFFNSVKKDCFNDTNLAVFDLYAHLISSIVTHEISTVRTLVAALKTANDMVHYRDPETGGHLERMARYSRLIAMELASQGMEGFNDEFIEHVFLFAPMHDIGKIGIPDDILLKPGKLNDKEFEVMQTHAAKGRELIDSMIEHFSLDSFRDINVLRNIAECHHEAMDGSGYPNHLKRGEIPIEARIIAVADIFDALTSQRPYKGAWSNEAAFDLLIELAKTKLDARCVEALVKHQDKVVDIQQQFQG